MAATKTNDVVRGRSYEKILLSYESFFTRKFSDLVEQKLSFPV